MNELNFIHVHQQIVSVSFHCHIRTSISFLKLNSAVGRSLSKDIESVADGNGEPVEGISPGPSTSTQPPPKKKKAKKKSSKLSSESVQPPSIGTETEDVIMLHEDIGTQTVETNFVQE